MSAPAIPQRYIPWLRALSVSMGIIATVMVFAPFYLPSVLSALYSMVAVDPMSPAMLEIMRGLFFHNLFFAQPGRYLFASLLAMGLVLAVVFLARPGRPMRVLLALSLMVVIAVPWVYSYQPAVSAAPGYRMLSATQPGLIEGVTKHAQQFAEVRPCDYSLLGWGAEDTLYYREQCRGGDARVMAIQPGREECPRPVEGPPPAVDAGSKRPVAEWVRSPSWTQGPDGKLVESAGAKPSLIGIKLREGGLASPSGEWVAIVARHIYSPEDVLILKKDADVR